VRICYDGSRDEKTTIWERGSTIDDRKGGISEKSGGEKDLKRAPAVDIGVTQPLSASGSRKKWQLLSTRKLRGEDAIRTTQRRKTRKQKKRAVLNTKRRGILVWVAYRNQPTAS